MLVSYHFPFQALFLRTLVIHQMFPVSCQHQFPHRSLNRSKDPMEPKGFHSILPKEEVTHAAG